MQLLIAGIIVQSADVYNAMITENTKEKKQRVLEEKRKELLDMANLVIPEEIKFKEDEEENIQVQKLARIQRKLDIYAYTHKQDIVELRQQVKELGEAEKTEENKEFLLKRVNEIQTKYKIFGRYIQNDDLEELYKVKFDVLMIDINRQKESTLKWISNERELECYKRIVEEKIEQIIQGTNPQLKEAFGEEQLRNAISMIKKVLKGDQRTFQIENILQDRTLLSLILAFDNPKGIERVSFDKENVDTELYEDLFEWENQIPLKSIFELRELEDRPITDNDNLYLRLYNMYNKHNIKNNDINQTTNTDLIYKRINKIPEGITRIKSTDCWSSENWFADILRRNIIEQHRKVTSKLRESHRIILPHTLKSIENGLFDRCTLLYDVKFNEGLEEISDEAFCGCRSLGEYETLKLPSTLKKIGNRSFFNCYNLHIELNEGLKEIGDYAFNFDSYYNVTEFSWGEPQTKLILPSSVENLGKDIVNDKAMKIVKMEKRIRALIKMFDKKERNDKNENPKK